MFNNNNADIAQEENDFRKRYAQELRKKKETDNNSINPHFGLNELSEERARVKQQALITPGRRGEQIKNEEIDKEILRRLGLRNRK
jgi:hypothetical protein